MSKENKLVVLASELSEELANKVAIKFAEAVCVVPKTTYTLQCKESDVSRYALRVSDYINGWNECNKGREDCEKKIVLASATLPSEPERIYRAYLTNNSRDFDCMRDYLRIKSISKDVIDWEWTRDIKQAKGFNQSEVLMFLTHYNHQFSKLYWEEVV